MKSFSYVVIAALVAGATPAFAQDAIPTTIDCSDPANAENIACLPKRGTTNFVPIAAGVGGLLALGGLAGGGSTTSTTSTTGTTGTN